LVLQMIYVLPVTGSPVTKQPLLASYLNSLICVSFIGLGHSSIYLDALGVLASWWCISAFSKIFVEQPRRRRHVGAGAWLWNSWSGSDGPSAPGQLYDTLPLGLNRCRSCGFGGGAATTSVNGRRTFAGGGATPASCVDAAGLPNWTAGASRGAVEGVPRDARPTRHWQWVSRSLCAKPGRPWQWVSQTG
jgi:hypothetical protein